MVEINAFRLRPITPGHPDWAASSHKGPCIVHAPSEQEARQLAALRFATIAAATADGNQPGYPWLRSDLVACVKLPVDRRLIVLGVIPEPAAPLRRRRPSVARLLRVVRRHQGPPPG